MTPFIETSCIPKWQQAEQGLHEAERQRNAAIGKLHALGLDPEQIAATLAIEPDAVRDHLAAGQHDHG